MDTRVVNIRNCPAGWQNDRQYVYIGRAGHGLSGYLGNPIRLMHDTPENRKEVLHKYFDYAAERIANDPKFAAVVKSLKGKTLVCFCKPKDCHGDILALLTGYINGRN